MVNLSVWCHAATDVVTITCIVDVFCLFTHVQQGSTVGERVITLSLVLSLSREANSLCLSWPVSQSSPVTSGKLMFPRALVLVTCL